MKPNRFGAFAEEDQVAAEVKQVQVEKKAVETKKKITVKVAKAPIDIEGAEEFEKVQDKNLPSRGGDRGRGGRGGRGGERGGRGGERGGRGGDRPRGDRVEGQEGERRGGDRRGRGRGDRPRTAAPTVAIDGVEVVVADGEQRPVRERAERRGRGGERGPRFEGKAREDAHPMDRQDGTGRGRRGDKKGGHGKGNWGKDEENKDGAPVVEGEERKERREPREPRERREPREPREPKVEEVKPEPIVEEEVGFTLDDYLAAKQAKSQGLCKKNEAREHQKIDAKNIKDFDIKHEEQATTRLYRNVEVQAPTQGLGGALLGFQALGDAGDEFEARGARGGRGGRGGDRPRQDRPQTQRGGRKGGKIVVDDNEFPAL